jgi:hypothetical protein
MFSTHPRLYRLCLLGSPAEVVLSAMAEVTWSVPGEETQEWLGQGLVLAGLLLPAAEPAATASLEWQLVLLLFSPQSHS